VLRFVVGESPRSDDGILRECIDQIDMFCRAVRARSRRRPACADKDYRLELTAQAFIRALDELEQSVYCAQRLAEGLTHSSTREMNAHERLNYHRHLYFYKNGFVRVFATLDKLGYFMNELFELKTERVKTKFSYFTVLRQMNRLDVQRELRGKLGEYKQLHKHAMDRLREKRNLEIHFCNVEVLDDLVLRQRDYLEYQHVENLTANMLDLQQGFDMVLRSMLAIFTEAVRYVRQTIDER
jgi:predicted nuclease of restriction endonuclease-like (RecB) superfamily